MAPLLIPSLVTPFSALKRHQGGPILPFGVASFLGRFSFFFLFLLVFFLFFFVSALHYRQGRAIKRWNLNQITNNVSIFAFRRRPILQGGVWGGEGGNPRVTNMRNLIFPPSLCVSVCQCVKKPFIAFNFMCHRLMFPLQLDCRFQYSFWDSLCDSRVPTVVKPVKSIEFWLPNLPTFY